MQVSPVCSLRAVGSNCMSTKDKEIKWLDSIMISESFSLWPKSLNLKECCSLPVSNLKSRAPTNRQSLMLAAMFWRAKRQAFELLVCNLYLPLRGSILFQD